MMLSCLSVRPVIDLGGLGSIYVPAVGAGKAQLLTVVEQSSELCFQIHSQLQPRSFEKIEHDHRQ